MSLDWSVANVQDWETTCYEITEDGSERLRTTTYDLIWGMLAIDMTGITKDNYHEVWLRLGTLELAQRGRLDEHSFSLADVKAHVGLDTNVSKKPGASFYKRLVAAANKLEWGLRE